ncbi:fibronectin type III domain containing protein 3C1-like [Saccopteryx leptura]|uniref:fibronectin type III domain containing protein 3C1-like n=1 Tax=Saccopteryx leptura TaxID=249018 RepID=UPI00339C2F64
MTEYGLAFTLTGRPPLAPVINGNPMYQMGSYHLNTPNGTQYTTNCSQIMTHPKRYTRWNHCPQYWIQQIVLVQVNAGETLTIKSDDGNIQNIQGPADVPLMSPSGTLPPIHLPPGYMSQVVEENGIHKIIIVPQTIDYNIAIPAPIPQIPHFIAPSIAMYQQAPQLMYPPTQGEFLPPYIQEPVPQQLPPPPPPLPPTFIYHEQYETYSHGRANYNQLDERAAKMEEYMKKNMREHQVDGHRNSYMLNNTSLLVSKTNDFSSIPGTPSTYTVDYTLSTYTVDNTSSIYTVNNAPSTYTVDNTLSTYTVDNALSTYTVDNSQHTYTIDSTSRTYTVDNVPRTYTVDNTLSAYTMDNALSTYTVDNTSRTYTVDNTPKTYTVNNTLSTSTYTVNNASCTYAVDNTPSTYTVNNAPSTYTVNNNVNIHTADNTHSTYTVDNPPSIYFADNTPRNSTDHVPSTSTTDNALHSSTIDRISIPSSMNYAPQTSTFDSTPRSSPIVNITRSSISDSAPNTTISDNSPSMAATDGALTTSSTASMSNTASAHVEINHTKKRSAMRSRDIKQKLGGKQNKSPSSNASEKECRTGHGKSCCFSVEKPVVSDIRTRSAIISWKPHGSEKCNHTKSPVTFELAISKSSKNGKYKNVYSGNGITFTLLELQPSMAYFVRITTIRGSAHKTVSEVVSFTTPGCEPNPPLAPALINQSKSSLNLQWKGLNFKPKYNGEDLSCSVRNLQRSATYKFRIFAYNVEERSNSSREVKYTTYPHKPGSPKKPYIKGKIHAHRVKIGWEPPKDDGGTYISSYSLEVSENSNGNSWNIIYNGTAKEFLYDRLQPGTTYYLRVFCTSYIGQSQPSDILTIQTPALSPASCRPPPLNGKTKSRQNNIQSGNLPTNGNSEAFAHFKEAKEKQNATQGHAGCRMKYTFGPHSTKYETMPSPSPPSQCGTPMLACKGSTCVVVSWEIPLSNGAEITEYRLKWGQTEESMHLIYTGPCPSYEVKGLIPATTYFCRVQAVNIVGVGMFGGTGRVTTPATVPAIVPMIHEVKHKVSAKLASSCIAIQWEEPDCHGSPITGYNIDYGDKKMLTVGKVTECLLKNLQADTTYKIRIQAINHYGLSPFSQSIRAKTKPLPPEPPHLDCVVCGHQSLKLKWGNSSSKGLLSNLVSYNLLMEDQSGRFSVIYHGPRQTHRVQRLSEYTQYKFKIQACNEAGEGPLSDTYIFTTTKTPPATLKAPKLHQVNSSICEVKWESLEPIKGDPIIYNLQLINEKETVLIYKGPDTSFFFSNFLTNSHYRFKVCAGRQYQNSAGLQQIWGSYSPSALFSTQKQQPGTGKGGGRKGRSCPSKEKPMIEMSNDTFVLILMIGFALVAILCAVTIQYFLIN